jgi:hypothetical protein
MARRQWVVLDKPRVALQLARQVSAYPGLPAQTASRYRATAERR